MAASTTLHYVLVTEIIARKMHYHHSTMITEKDVLRSCSSYTVHEWRCVSRQQAVLFEFRVRGELLRLVAAIACCAVLCCRFS
jgi:hypothetical protein